MSRLPYRCGNPECGARYSGERAAEGCCDGKDGAIRSGDGDTKVGI